MPQKDIIMKNIYAGQYGDEHIGSEHRFDNGWGNVGDFQVRIPNHYFLSSQLGNLTRDFLVRFPDWPKWIGEPDQKDFPEN